MKRGRRSWRKLDGAEKSGEIKKTGDDSRENKRKIKIFHLFGKITL